MPHTLRNCYHPEEISGFFFLLPILVKVEKNFWFLLCVKNGNFADPDKESLTEKGAGVTSDLSKEPCPCHVRPHLNYRFNISIAF